MKHFREYAMIRNDLDYMAYALDAAEHSKAIGNRAIGACLLLSNNAIYSEGDTSWSEDPTHRASINVMQKAKDVGAKTRDAVLYSSLEPTPFEVLMAVECGVKEIIFGAYYPEGFVSSGILNLDKLPITYKGGVMAKECIEILPDRLREQAHELS
jgi:tRNA(Arg) A34 adenosine deaminase TadA